MSFPFSKLPIELIREIFEHAAFDDHQAAYTLLFVSREIRHWVEPVLYRRLTFRSVFPKIDFDVCRSQRRDDAFFSRTVRELRILNDTILLSLLNLFTGLTHLFLRIGTGLLVLDNVPFYNFPDLRHLPLRHLIVDEISVALKIKLVPRTITHLQLNSLGPSTVYTGTLSAVLDRCRSLTHLMFDTDRDHQEDRLHEALASLGNYPSLRCVAVVVSYIDAEFEAMARIVCDQHSGLIIVNTGAPRAMDTVMDVDVLALKSFDFWYEVEIFMARKRERVRAAAKKGIRA